jgi:predicted outer membrane protein
MDNLSRRHMLVAGLPIAGLAAVALSQNRRGSGGSSEIMDPAIAARLLINGYKQITVCELALDGIRDREVARFAEAEIREHEGLRDQLQRRGFDYEVAGADPRQPTRESTERILPARFAFADSAPPSGAMMVLRVDHEVAQQCIATQRVEMARLRGDDFDRRFVEHQLDAHYDLFDQVNTYRLHSSEDFVALLGDARYVIERHMSWCKEMRAQLA